MFNNRIKTRSLLPMVVGMTMEAVVGMTVVANTGTTVKKVLQVT
jgi:hypothetical protein